MFSELWLGDSESNASNRDLVSEVEDPRNYVINVNSLMQLQTFYTVVQSIGLADLTGWTRLWIRIIFVY